MRVYAIRHARTTETDTDRFQNEETPLGADGAIEAMLFSPRIWNLGITTVVTSDALRARQTGNRIAAKHDLRVISSPLFIDRRRPSEELAAEKGSPEALEIWKQMEEHFHDPDWRYSDEETQREFMDRIDAGFNYLETVGGQPLLVTHSGTLKGMVAKTLAGSEDPFAMLRAIKKGTRIFHTGFSLFEKAKTFYDTAPAWKLVFWNDTVHLNNTEFSRL